MKSLKRWENQAGIGANFSQEFGSVLCLQTNYYFNKKVLGLSHQESFDLHLNNYFDVKLQKWVPKEDI